MHVNLHFAYKESTSDPYLGTIFCPAGQLKPRILPSPTPPLEYAFNGTVYRNGSNNSNNYFISGVGILWNTLISNFSRDREGVQIITKTHYIQY